MTNGQRQDGDPCRPYVLFFRADVLLFLRRTIRCPLSHSKSISLLYSVFNTPAAIYTVSQMQVIAKYYPISRNLVLCRIFLHDLKSPDRILGSARIG
jgi:hypothetical protein